MNDFLKSSENGRYEFEGLPVSMTFIMLFDDGGRIETDYDAAVSFSVEGGQVVAMSDLIVEFGAHVLDMSDLLEQPDRALEIKQQCQQHFYTLTRYGREL